MSETESVRVEAYAGASYPERPIAIIWEDKRLTVRRLIRQWRTPDDLHFLVEVEKLGRVELIYHSDAWQILL